MKQKTIFTITVLVSKEFDHNPSTSRRPLGYYFKFSDAEDVVLENQSDIFEYLYDLAVIEEYEQRPLAVATNRKWYKAVYPGGGKNPKVRKIREPKQFKGIINFAMG